MAKRKIMRAFKIDELSAVDTPAQEGAQMVLMKRKHPEKDDDKKPGKKPPFGNDKKPAKDDDKKPGKDDKDDDKKKKPPFMSKTVLMTEDHPDGHSHLILGASDTAGFTSHGGASNESGHQHPWVTLADGSVVVGASHGHGHDLREGITKFILTAGQLEHFSSPDEDVAKLFTAWQTKNIESGIAMKDGSFPIETPEDVAMALECYEEWGDNSAAISHIMKRAKVLDVELPTDGELAIVFKNTQLASDKDLSKENEIMTKKIENTEGDFEKQLEDAAVKQAATEVELKVATQLAEMNDVQKDFYIALGIEDATEFLAKSFDEREATIKKSLEADTVVYASVDGTEYHKSDDPRMVALAKKADADAKEIAKMKKDAEDKTYAKRAGEELQHLPGTEESKVATLKAIDGIENEDLRKASLETLHASNENMAKAFDEHGTASSPASNSAQEELDAMAKKYSEDNKVDMVKALSAVCKTPQGNALYIQVDQKH